MREKEREEKYRNESVRETVRSEEKGTWRMKRNGEYERRGKRK